MTMQEVEIFGSELKERIKVTKSRKTDIEQSSEQNHIKLNFATMSKRLIFSKHTCKWKRTHNLCKHKQEESKMSFLYFSRKYEAHKALFSKETNLLGRDYRFSFQK